jgi:hypothetical protein
VATYYTIPNERSINRNQPNNTNMNTNGNILREQVLGTTSDDRLGRAGTAKLVYDRIVATSPSISVRIAILGEWGSGKTTVAEWAVQMLKKRDWVVVRFAPWRMTTSEELWQNFAIALQQAVMNQCGTKTSTLDKTRAAGRKIGEFLEPAGEALGWGSVLLKTVQSASQMTEKDVEKLRGLLSDRRVVVIIDDLDRTDPKLLPPLFLNIREVFESSGFVFLVPFDWSIVERALSAYSSAWGAAGHLFLEKIFDFRINLPVPSPSARIRFLNELLKSALDNRKATLPESLGDAMPPIPRRLKAIARQILVYRGDIDRYDETELDFESLVIGAAMKAESEDFYSLFVQDYASITLELAASEGEILDSKDPKTSTKALSELSTNATSSDTRDMVNRLARLTQYCLEKKELRTWNSATRALRVFEGSTPMTSKEFRWLPDVKKDSSSLDAYLNWSGREYITFVDFQRQLLSHAILQLREYHTTKELIGSVMSNDLTRCLDYILLMVQDIEQETSGMLRLSAFESIAWLPKLNQSVSKIVDEHRKHTLFVLISKASQFIEQYADILQGGAEERSERIERYGKAIEVAEEEVVDLIVTEFQRHGGLDAILSRRTSSMVAYLLLYPSSALWGTSDQPGPLPKLLSQRDREPIVAENALMLEKILNAEISQETTSSISDPLSTTSTSKVTRIDHHPWNSLRKAKSVRDALRGGGSR